MQWRTSEQVDESDGHNVLLGSRHALHCTVPFNLIVNQFYGRTPEAAAAQHMGHTG